MSRWRPAVLDELLADINRQGGNAGSTGREPVVSLELFFEGNTDTGSIGCNLTDHPGVDRFYAVLRGIRDRVDVHAVWVGITEVLGPDEWPFSDHVYVVTTATPEDVTEWAAELEPDPPVDWWTDFPPIPVPTGAHIVTLFWD
jgi:hypothetical protein